MTQYRQHTMHTAQYIKKFIPSVSDALGASTPSLAPVPASAPTARSAAATTYAPRPAGARASFTAGFTLLYASLVSALLLSVGVAIFDITIKEVILSSIARDSAYAVYTADTGLECAFYWDFKNGGANVSAFATSSTSAYTPTFSCNNQSITPSRLVTLTAATSTFSMTLSPQSYCVTVTVAKYGTPTNTTITSHGYNTCNTSDPRRIERTLQATY